MVARDSLDDCIARVVVGKHPVYAAGTVCMYCIQVVVREIGEDVVIISPTGSGRVSSGRVGSEGLHDITRQ